MIGAQAASSSSETVPSPLASPQHVIAVGLGVGVRVGGTFFGVAVRVGDGVCVPSTGQVQAWVQKPSKIPSPLKSARHLEKGRHCDPQE